MNRDQQLKTLKSPKASKEQLREALAASLGVEYEAQTKEKAVTLFTQCRDAFLEEYKRQTNIDYSFQAIDGRALAQLIEKVRGIIQFPTDEAIVATFRLLILKLPDWYKQNAFALKTINNKFNEIVASISKNGNGKQQVTSDFKDRVAERIRARQFKQ